MKEKKLKIKKIYKKKTYSCNCPYDRIESLKGRKLEKLKIYKKKRKLTFHSLCSCPYDRIEDLKGKNRKIKLKFKKYKRMKNSLFSNLIYLYLMSISYIVNFPLV